MNNKKKFIKTDKLIKKILKSDKYIVKSTKGIFLSRKDKDNIVKSLLKN